MNVTDLKGNVTKWKMKGKVVNADSRPRSSLHKAARALIQETFPTLQLLEEVPIETGHKRTLYLDFYLPLRKLAIEVHGRQHYEFNSHFHKDRWAFIRSMANDRLKEEWCDLNNIGIVTLKYDEQDSWRVQLNPSVE